MRRRWSAKRVHFVLLPSVPVDPVLWRPLRWRICYQIDTRKPTRGPSERIKKTQTIRSHSARWQCVPLWSASARVLTWLSSTLLRRIPDFWREQRSSWQATRTSKRLSKLCAWRVRPSECDAPSRPHAVFAAFSPSRASTASRMMNFWILPVTVIGNSSTNSTYRGILLWAIWP